MVFKRRADAREIQRHGIIHVSNAVRIAGVHGRDDPCFSEHIDRLLEESLPRCRDRDLLRPKLRTAHAHAHSLDRAVGHIQPERLDAGACLDRELGLIRQAAVMDIFAHAADGVAAHLGARAVGIVHFHAKIRDLRRADQHEPVAADAEMAIRQPDCRTRRIGHSLGEAVDIDIVIAAALHFCKLHMQHLQFGIFCTKRAN